MSGSRKSSPYGRASRAILAGLVINVALGLAKLVAGLLGQSFALVADAVNSLGDGLISVAVLSALRFAQRPADRRHPYGHTRAEAIAASNVALVIVFSAAIVGWEAIRRLPDIHALPPVWALWIAAANVVIKEGLYRYNAATARTVGSGAVLANAWDHRADALCSLAVLVGLAVVRLGGERLMWADDVAALVVVVLIVWSGVTLFLRGANELLDVQADPELERAVHAAASSVPGVECIETLRLRKSGLEYFADVHIEVDPMLPVVDGHRIAHDVKDVIRDRCHVVRDVLVHVEPFDPTEVDA